MFWGLLVPHTYVLEWAAHVAYEKALNIVARINSRVFVGLPLCIIVSPPKTNIHIGRNPEYLSRAIGYTTAVGMAAMFLKLMPKYLRP